MRRIIQDSQSKKRRGRFGLGQRVGRVDRYSCPRVEALEDRCVPTTITLTPSKDNTLYESATGATSNGAGDFFFVGRTNQASDSIRRGLIAFNFGSIPAGATINSVSLKLNMSKTPGGSTTVALHRLTADWGEGTSNANANEGGGASSTTNDATWIHRFFSSSNWARAGGDFAATASATQSVGGFGSYTWNSTAQLVADVQGWVNTSSTNFGWVILGDESTGQTAKRFDSKENGTAANRPELTVDYTEGSSFTPISISGQTFNDLNGNGTKDAGDPGLANWTMFLDNNNNGTQDSGEPTATTDANGNYTFSNLGQGTYRVREVVQAGWQRTTAIPADIVAQSGVNVSGRDFGNFRLITLSGAAYNDLNGNGTREASEPALQNWTLNLDVGADGTVDRTATTDANGNYSFADLGPGTYRLRAVVQVGWLQTTTNPADVAASSGTNATGRDFGNFRLITLSGMAFEDLNANGTKEATEPGLPNWTINLDISANGTVDRTATTDANGNYSFADLGPGIYRLREVLQAGFLQGTPNPADVVASSGTNATGRDFGNFRLGEIRGAAFEDLNGNGTKDTGEPAQAGWTVFLDQNNNGLFDQSQTTLAAGDVPKPLPDLSTTTSTLAVTGLSGRILDVNLLLNITHPFDSDLTAFLVSPAGTRIRLFARVGAGGQNFTNTVLDDDATVAVTAGLPPFLGSFRPETPLSGLNGQNPNGTWTLELIDAGAQDSGTLQGWSLTLRYGEISATTNSSGAYAFPGLTPGSHIVREVVQAGWQPSLPGGPDFRHAVMLNSNQTLADRDFGNFRRGEIRGVAFNDANNNRVKDAGEAGLPGWVVYLDANANAALDQRTLAATSTQVPRNITDLTTATSTVPVKGAGRILDTTVNLTITHTRTADLLVFLVSPAGTRVELFSRVGGGGSNFTNTTLDDKATTAITAGTAPFTGSFRPVGLLASLLGQDPTGTWTLQITDETAANTGSLVSWSLNFILATEPITVTNASGAFAFPNLNPGSHNLREVVPTGWTQTLPGTPDFRYTVTLTSGQLVVDRDFGNNRSGGGGGTPLIEPPSEEPPADETLGSDVALAMSQGDRFDGAARPSRLLGTDLQEASAGARPSPVLPHGTSGSDRVLAWDFQTEFVDQVFASHGRMPQEEALSDLWTGDDLADFLTHELDDRLR